MKLRISPLFTLTVVLVTSIIVLFTTQPTLFRAIFTDLIVGISVALIIQSLFTIYTMIYTWNDFSTYEDHRSPKEFAPPTYRFSALVAARSESRVIGDTIRAIHSLNYPTEMKELILVVRHDDLPTIHAAQKALDEIQNPFLKLIVSDQDLKNKPMSLNTGLAYATGDIVVVFDAEDEPQPDIYQAVNTTFIRKQADVVQSGVQLMDYRSSWYATLNVLEYYFWFKSALHFFARVGAVPLGGNTVFFKKTAIDSIGGWNEQLLTEDADIGIRLSLNRAKITIIYDEKHTTREETPPTYKSFIKQRTRWNQGFLQILFQGAWLKLPQLSQKLLIAYVLSTPILQALWLFYLPFCLFMITFIKLPVVLTLFSFIPLYLLGFQYVLYTVGLYLFTRDYQTSYPIWMPFKLLYTLYPYQILLGWSSIQATRRLVKKDLAWEKTEHTNAHRIPVVPAIEVLQT